jgi:hypothetical protein
MTNINLLLATVENFFLSKEEESYSRYIINPELTLNFKSDQESAQYLVVLIRFWEKKIEFFCYDSKRELKREGEKEKSIELPENEWEFQYKYPTYSCPRCRRGHEILDKIFGDTSNFTGLPFVSSKGDRVYTFNFGLLKQFAENGHASMLRLIKSRNEEAKRKDSEEKEKERRRTLQKLEAELDAELNGRLITKELRKLLVFEKSWNQFLSKQEELYVITIVNPSIAIKHSGCNEKIRVICENERYKENWEWKWADNDEEKRKHYLVLGKIQVSEKEDELTVAIEFKKYSTSQTLVKSFTVMAVFIPDSPKSTEG